MPLPSQDCELQCTPPLSNWAPLPSPPLQAFRCSVCNYTAERRRPECGGHPHAVERITATKRWWECEHCTYRFATVGVRYPNKRCTK